jgi:hypothetical protein
MEGGRTVRTVIRMRARMNRRKARRSKRIFRAAKEKAARLLMPTAVESWTAQKTPPHLPNGMYGIVLLAGSRASDQEEEDEFEGFTDPDTGLNSLGTPSP